ncbi:hypothetical protein BDK51DRAFT_41996 [Blyttiomyces helicus]|uniref:Uncharacterized protein n=1 Tax=Blyttiomyces helicus TaxID=388810 RepID=A0A4P9WMB7_9FUNG|nr:hypothetical protein BDK51DRAFT_41996 [Blyttiomyces helicus]|eukprot:RKO93163.1 hypothetical protein BDK51DRAFT_41996 [Blyttiomyces helicus]
MTGDFEENQLAAMRAAAASAPKPAQAPRVRKRSAEDQTEGGISRGSGRIVKRVEKRSEMSQLSKRLRVRLQLAAFKIHSGHATAAFAELKSSVTTTPAAQPSIPSRTQKWREAFLDPAPGSVPDVAFGLSELDGSLALSFRVPSLMKPGPGELMTGRSNAGCSLAPSREAIPTPPRYPTFPAAIATATASATAAAAEALRTITHPVSHIGNNLGFGLGSPLLAPRARHSPSPLLEDIISNPATLLGTSVADPFSTNLLSVPLPSPPESYFSSHYGGQQLAAGPALYFGHSLSSFSPFVSPETSPSPSPSPISVASSSMSTSAPSTSSNLLRAGAASQTGWYPLETPPVSAAMLKYCSSSPDHKTPLRNFSHYPEVATFLESNRVKELRFTAPVLSVLDAARRRALSSSARAAPTTIPTAPQTPTASSTPKPSVTPPPAVVCARDDDLAEYFHWDTTECDPYHPLVGDAPASTAAAAAAAASLFTSPSPTASPSAPGLPAACAPSSSRVLWEQPFAPIPTRMLHTFRVAPCAEG